MISCITCSMCCCTLQRKMHWPFSKGYKMDLLEECFQFIHIVHTSNKLSNRSSTAGKEGHRRRKYK